MLNVVCIQSGNYLGRGAEYVNVLFDSIRRNLPAGYAGRFVCFTDDDRCNYESGIEVRPLPSDLPGWWGKLALFREGLFPVGDRVVYFDLDTVITGRLDEILAYDGDFCILKDFCRPGGWQSSVMAWRVGVDEVEEIWESYVEAGCPTLDPGGDQAWIERVTPPSDHWQTLFPDLFVSYKLLVGVPHKASVVVFHGDPRPHAVRAGWVPEVWKIGGLTRADLKLICNVEQERLLANVRSACRRNLPWFDFEFTAHSGHAVIVGGGPSLKHTISDIKRRKEYGQEVWALNNSAEFLIENGIVPDAHFLVDARPENVEFLKNPNPKTLYYIGSQCDPCVFDALKGFRVVLWHVQSDGMDVELADVKDKPVHFIGGGGTIALHAVSMAFLLGYRKIHCYGLDSSYAADGQHHAYQQLQNEGDPVLDVLYADQKFRAAPWMTGQAEQFIELARQLRECGTIITVHGEGLLPTMYRDDMMYGPATPAELRAREIIVRIDRIENPVGVELGVFTGRMSRALLEHAPLRLHMVDSWEGDGAAYMGESHDWHARLPQDAQNNYMQEAELRTSFAQHRRTIIRDRSTDASKGFLDETLDFVFIDADHSYEGCRADINAWAPKIKPGGWLCGHDYQNLECPFPGVEKAVHEFLAETGLQVELGDNYTWFVQIPPNRQTQRNAA